MDLGAIWCQHFSQFGALLCIDLQQRQKDEKPVEANGNSTRLHDSDLGMGGQILRRSPRAI